MRILFINEVCGHGSTGRICAELAEKYEAANHEVKIAFGRDNYVPDKYKKYAVRIGTDFDVYLHALYTRIMDKHGLASKRATKRFLRWADEYNPDIIWLHNLHGYYINYELLFEWIKKRPNTEVKWTLHDCWAFTGHCSYFVYKGCEKWKKHCYKCPQKHEYPTSFIVDNSSLNYDIKKKAFSGIKKMEIIVPSHWLEGLVKKSFFKNYSIKVIYNEVDRNTFKPTLGDFRERYGLQNKKIILGVASPWTERKGLGDFIELSKMLSDEYCIVLVGLSDRQIKKIPQNIRGIKRTDSTAELASIYTTADLFVNASKEETFGLTTIEANYCGTDAIVYRGTACEEVINEFGRGLVVEPGVNNLYKAIIDMNL